MANDPTLLSQYLEHLHARLRARANKARPEDIEGNLKVLPQPVRALASEQPRECLALVVDALVQVDSPNLVQAIGDDLLETLVNEHASELFDELAALVRTNERFRYAFASGTWASVDPALINDWTEIFLSLGTTKQKERKRLWSPKNFGR